MANFWENLVGGPKKSTTTTTTTEKPSSNTGLIVAGVILGLGALVGILYLAGVFKKKEKPAA